VLLQPPWSSRQEAWGSRLHVNLHGLRVNSIGDYDQLVVARGNRVRHVEVSMSELFSHGHGHRGMVVGPAEMDLVGMPQADKRIVASHLGVITVPVGLREAVQLPSAQPVGMSAAQDLGNVRNMRAPMVVRGSARSIHFDARSAVGIEHLATIPQRVLAEVGIK
jgi:hypothetical protein